MIYIYFGFCLWKLNVYMVRWIKEFMYVELLRGIGVEDVMVVVFFVLCFVIKLNKYSNRLKLICVL